MVSEPPTGQDFLWPASEVDLEYYRNRGGSFEQSRNLLHSPIVLYPWDIITALLEQRGLVEQRSTSYYLKDMPGLLSLVEARTSWADLGLSQLDGSVKIIATDPGKSNSGNSFAGLLANMMNNGEIITANDADKLNMMLSRLQTFFARMGFLEYSSGVLWDKFISQGAGAYPLIVGYENQLVEYSLEHPQVQELLRQKVRTLYPIPTVWSSHPFIALNAEGSRLLDALQAPDVQRLAWERHGFRSGVQGLAQTTLQVVGLPASIEAVLPMPPATVMVQIRQTLEARP